MASLVALRRSDLYRERLRSPRRDGKVGIVDLVSRSQQYMLCGDVDDCVLNMRNDPRWRASSDAVVWDESRMLVTVHDGEAREDK